MLDLADLEYCWGILKIVCMLVCEYAGKILILAGFAFGFLPALHIVYSARGSGNIPLVSTELPQLVGSLYFIALGVLLVIVSTLIRSQFSRK